MRLSFGLVDTWHSKTPASSGVTNRTFRVFEFGLQHLLLQIATYTFSNCNIYFFKLQHLLFQNKFLPTLAAFRPISSGLRRRRWRRWRKRKRRKRRRRRRAVTCCKKVKDWAATETWMPFWSITAHRKKKNRFSLSRTSFPWGFFNQNITNTMIHCLTLNKAAVQRGWMDKG